MRSEKLTDDARHDLDVVDAVVRGGGHARPEDAALTDFALLVRSARPLPDHAATLRLDQRLAGGSSVAGRPRKRLLAVAASLVLVLGVGGVAITGLQSQNGDQAISGKSTRSLEGGDVARQASTAADTSVAPGQVEGLQQGNFVAPNTTPAPVTSPVAKAIQRDVARTARLTLATEGRKVEDLSDRVIATVDDAGGYVATSSVRSARGNRGTAQFSLMLPAATFQETFAELSKLAHVRSRSQSTEDITAQSQSAERTLARARARVKHFEGRLAAATTAAERASLKARLQRARFVERQALRQVRGNRSRVSYVPLELKIVADNKAAAADRGPIGKALHRAASILTAILAFLIVALAVALPITIVCALVYFGLRWRRRSLATRTLGETAAQAE